MSARRRLPSIGPFVNPVLWWLRLWGLGPDREKELTEARSVLERQQARVENLSAQLRLREADADQLQARVRQLEQLQAEVEQLRLRVVELEAQPASSNAVEATDEPGATDEPELPRAAATSDGQPAATAEVEAIEEPGATDEPELPRDAATSDGQPAPSQPDVTEAAAVLGVRIVVDDLRAIEGIGPKIASLLNAAGITTWQELSEANPGDLRQILTDAGPRYRLHDPENWPAQAALLAGGRWDEFKQLSERVRRPRTG